MGKWVTSPESLSLITWAPNHFSLYSGAVRTSLPVGILLRSELSRLLSSFATYWSVITDCFVLFSTWCLLACTFFRDIPAVRVCCAFWIITTYYFFVSCGLPLTHLLYSHVLCSLSVMFLSLPCRSLLPRGTLYLI